MYAGVSVHCILGVVVISMVSLSGRTTFPRKPAKPCACRLEGVRYTSAGSEGAESELRVRWSAGCSKAKRKTRRQKFGYNVNRSVLTGMLDGWQRYGLGGEAAGF